MGEEVKKKVMELLSKVVDPELGVSLIEYEMIREEWVHVNEDAKTIEVLWVPTTPFCPILAYIAAAIRWVLKQAFPEWNIKVKLHPDVLGADHWNQVLENDEEMETILKTMESKGYLNLFIRRSD